MKPSFSSLLKRPAAMSVVSYFFADRLEIIFLRNHAGGRQEIENKLWVPVPESISDKEAVSIQKQIAEHLEEPALWVHIVMRQGGFVKTFSVADLPEDQMGAVLLKRVNEEMPHLAQDILYHIGLQNSDLPERREALLFGISKAALEDQLAKLSRFEIVPDSVMLSTEVLLWYYQNSSGAKRSESAMLIHEAGRQLELIYVNQGRLVQSRWFKKDAYEQEGIEALLQTANDSFQREARTAPGKAVVMGGDFRTPQSFGNIPHEFLERESPEEAKDPVLWKAAIQAYENSAVFDFTPAHWEERRMQRKMRKESSSLLLWSIFLAGSVLLFSFTQVVSAAAQGAWIAAKKAPLSSSVKELKVLQSKAMAAKTYQRKKVFPILLLEKMRAAIPTGVLLEKLEYQQSKSSFAIRGEAVSENLIHDFLGALQKQAFLSGLALEGIEARKDDGGKIYEFEIKGFLAGRSAS